MSYEVELLGILKAIKKLSFDVDRVDKDGINPLSRAVTLGSHVIVEALLELGANPENGISKTKNYYIASEGYTLYTKDKSPNRLRILRSLFQRTLRKDHKYGNTTFFITDAVNNGDSDALRIFLDTDQWPSVSGDDHNPVLRACVQCFEQLEDKRIDILKMILDSRIEKEKYVSVGNALKYCDKNGLDQCKRELLSYIKRVYPVIPEFIGQIECLQTYKQLVDEIVTEGGIEALNVTTKEERCLLASACLDSDYDRIACLLERGARIDTVDSFGLQPIHYAARTSSVIVSLLLQYGVDVETRDGYGKTPLMYAALYGRITACKTLLEKGADVHATTKTGKTALIYALKNSSMDIARLLLKHGASPDITKNFCVNKV